MEPQRHSPHTSPTARRTGPRPAHLPHMRRHRHRSRPHHQPRPGRHTRPRKPPSTLHPMPPRQDRDRSTDSPQSGMGSPLSSPRNAPRDHLTPTPKRLYYKRWKSTVFFKTQKLFSKGRGGSPSQPTEPLTAYVLGLSLTVGFSVEWCSSFLSCWN